ncbi:hypothetical protein N7528_002178 [Penicillium herquei]|nr:hypothetical protein N7528_002178 [Penicillium herquei]
MTEYQNESPKDDSEFLRPLFGVQGLVAVITGGGTGIGKMAAHALLAGGAKAVYILGRRAEALQACRDSSPRPEAIFPIICDVTSKTSLQDACDQVKREIGYCDLLFANAGVPEIPRQILDRSSVKTIQEGLLCLEMDSYEQIYRINTLGAFQTAVSFLQLLEEGNKRAEVPQKSQILITSSVTGKTSASYGTFGYAASKAALNVVANQLAGILLPHKIRVNTLVAGIYSSEMTDGMLKMTCKSDPTVEGALDSSCIPLERIGRVEDMIGLILFLASKAGGYISGAELVTDGGMLSIPPSWAMPTPPVHRGV